MDLEKNVSAKSFRFQNEVSDGDLGIKCSFTSQLWESIR